MTEEVPTHTFETNVDLATAMVTELESAIARVKAGDVHQLAVFVNVRDTDTGTCALLLCAHRQHAAAFMQDIMNLTGKHLWEALSKAGGPLAPLAAVLQDITDIQSLPPGGKKH